MFEPILLKIVVIALSMGSAIEFKNGDIFWGVVPLVSAVIIQFFRAIK